ncbi:aminotransferase class V-fold PLP-dependent enzyme [Bacillus aerolatus]|uniref:Aminotransferase class V-fold PLP-dependent enzyme n=1 Tax=Bacillus aerolatus TaxID=2653354 RepID=A0A6I1FGB7_9BACI|nr:aminotransferase class I/II-fold pyridoxal phosphate-dependent enzyme [Bacillus aerolatus]KAB7704331.1 aminotransferase class V-fold PLP-dependent enzyme [Bacillus aerolatus]
MSQEQIPLINALQQYAKQQPLSFHVPGHKNGLVGVNGQLKDFQAFLRYDATEVSGLDDFHSPEGCILEAQQLLTELYHTRKSYFLVNGSTVGNLAMVMAVCEEGDTVFVQRNCHKSIVNALKLTKLQPVFLDTEYDTRMQTAGAVSLDTVKQAYSRYPSVKAIILTYPNYYGMAAPLKAIIQLAKQNGSFVLIDEAHGPHFILQKPFPPSSLTMGADIVVHSAHKMLPAMTMGSYLHVHSKEVPLAKLEFYLQALQSSSPSYPIMASLDLARAYLASITEEDLASTRQMREKLVSLLQLKNIETLFPDDPLKLALRKRGYSGYELQERLEEAGIYTELADASQVLCTLPLVKKGHNDFLFHAEKKIVSLIIEDREERIPMIMPLLHEEKISSLVLSYKEQEHCSTKWVNVKKAAGRIAAETIIPYPPGISLIMAGERVSKEQAIIVEELLAQQVHIQGGQRLTENKLAVFSEEGLNK